MTTFVRFRHILVSIMTLLSWLLPSHAMAQASVGQLFFRPHCQQSIQQLCPVFATRDPLTLETSNLSVGDTFDIDLVFQNSNLKPVQDFRVWITYDPSILEGTGLKVDDAFTVPVPGGTEFNTQEGYIKLEAGRDGVTINGSLLPLGRIVFKVKQVPAGNMTVLSIHDVQPTTTGNTYVRTTSTDSSNLLATLQGSLQVRINGSAQATSSAQSFSSIGGILTGPVTTVSSVSSLPSVTSSISTTPAAPTRTVFTLLQPQNVRAGTDGSTVYVTWDTLTSSELIGYNVYYGTRSGEYAQRRSLLPELTSMTIRDLPLGSDYFVAVRGVNAKNEETAFSQEVRLTVGDARSSTAPLQGKIIGGTKNPIKKPSSTNVPGETGLPLIAIGIVALLGACTTLYFSRSSKRS